MWERALMDMAYEILQTMLQTFETLIKNSSVCRLFLWQTNCTRLVSLRTCVINSHPNTRARGSVQYVQPVRLGRLAPALEMPSYPPNAAEFIGADVFVENLSDRLWSGVRPMSRHGHIQLQRHTVNASLWNGAGMHQSSGCCFFF